MVVPLLVLLKQKHVMYDVLCCRTSKRFLFDDVLLVFCITGYLSPWRNLKELISPWTKWLPFRRRYLQMHFRELKVLFIYFYWQQTSVGVDNGLAPNKQAIVWNNHDDVIKWKHFPRNWPFVREIHRSPVNFPHKGQWRGALMFSLIYTWINDWVNNREAGDLRRQHGHYDVIVMAAQFTDAYMWH